MSAAAAAAWVDRRRDSRAARRVSPMRRVGRGVCRFDSCLLTFTMVVTFTMGINRETSSRSRAALTVASLGLATDALVYGMAVPVLPKIATEHGSRPLGVGVMFAVYAAALVAATPAAGLWVDRQGNRRPLLAGVAGLAAATALFAFARDPSLLILARALQGAAAGIVWTAGLALIAATHGPAERGKAMGIALSTFAVGTLLGPPLGGLLAGWFDPRVPFLLACALALADGAVRWFLVPADTGPAVRGGIREVRGRPGLALVALLTATGAALIAFMEPILPLHLFTTENAGTGEIGLVFGAAGVAAAVAPSLAGYALARLAPGVVAGTGCVVAAVALLLLGGPLDGVVQSAVGLALVTGGASLVLTPTVTVMSRIAESRQPPVYGAVYAVYTLAYTGGLAVAPFGAGWAMQGLGFDGAARTAAAVAALLTVLVFAWGRRYPARPPADSVETAAGKSSGANLG
ncbi:MFS transporter [Actinomadura chibensis]|uniref:MFS transporter n=2 Tax=Actinomadura chibensis TaxID=392828 RepID=A0A5D0NYD1_9ACTN|nr:MFS transporter [Actinomadura chibensis]